MSTLNVDLDLVRKYNVAGPRYTSYPPATRFVTMSPQPAPSPELTWEQLSDEILLNNRTADRDLSLYFHIPFCQSLCWYCGCTTVITTQKSKGAVYVDYLEKEVARMATLLNPARKVTQMHFGGGTPTFLQPAQLRRLGQLIRNHFQVAPDVEGGVEIDPRSLSRDHLVALREIGFKRASVGVQDFDPEVQKAVHRIQPRELTTKTIAALRQLGFESVNVDLIYGLPKQTPESFARTLDAVLEIQPDRFAVFSYAHVPWIKPAQKALENGVLPTAEVKLQLLKLVIEKLTGAGYLYIGMDHFARPTDELAVAQRHHSLQRNFQGYSTRGDTDIYAFGMSSISKTSNAYWQNEKELKGYYAALDAGKLPITRGCLLTDEDQIRRETITRLMCNLELNFASMSQKLGLNFTNHFAQELDSLADLEADGLLVRSHSGLQVTDLGRLFIRNIAMRFDAYLPQESERRFSRTI